MTENKLPMTRERAVGIRARAMLTDDGDLADLGGAYLELCAEVEHMRHTLTLIACAVYPTYTMYGAQIVFVDAGVVENLKRLASEAIQGNSE